MLDKMLYNENLNKSMDYFTNALKDVDAKDYWYKFDAALERVIDDLLVKYSIANEEIDHIKNSICIYAISLMTVAVTYTGSFYNISEYLLKSDISIDDIISIIMPETENNNDNHINKKKKSIFKVIK